jgi:hypothetical protein
LRQKEVVHCELSRLRNAPRNLVNLLHYVKNKNEHNSVVNWDEKSKHFSDVREDEKFRSSQGKHYESYKMHETALNSHLVDYI